MTTKIDYSQIKGAPVNAKDKGAVCDGVTDDTAAVQAAIDFCAANNWPDLEVPGPCLLTASINIDRLVDSAAAREYFTIRGTGGGFYVNGAITMFTSTLTSATDPQSQMILFDNVNFKSNVAADAAYVCEGIKFLRMRFNKCSFNQIKLLTCSRYLQTWYLDGCNVRNWLSNFITGTAGANDLKINQSIFEAGAQVCAITDATGVNIVSGFAFTNNLVEGYSSNALGFDNVRGMVISGNYFEQGGSSLVDIAFNTAANIAATSPNYGIVLEGNYFAQNATNRADPTYYSVQWGNCKAVKSSGNYCNDQLHGTTAASWLMVVNDFQATSSGKLLGFKSYGNASVAVATTAGDATFGSDTTNGAMIIGKGASSDITLLNNSGTGAFRIPTGATTAAFGVFNATGDVVSNGYLTVFDYAGNARKIMITA